MQLLNSVPLKFKMNEYFLLTGDKFMSDNQDLFIVLVDPLQKKKERIQNFKETGDANYIYQKKLDMACFQHDMAYGF